RARTGSPKGSRPGLPTVQRPKLKRSARVGSKGSLVFFLLPFFMCGFSGARLSQTGRGLGQPKMPEPRPEPGGPTSLVTVREDEPPVLRRAEHELAPREHASLRILGLEREGHIRPEAHDQQPPARVGRPARPGARARRVLPA